MSVKSPSQAKELSLSDNERHRNASATGEPEPDHYWVDMLMYGVEHLVRGSDTGTLVAFAALAFQQIRGKGEPHQTLGCGILLLSVLMCAVVHLAIGNAYVGRARLVYYQKPETRGYRMIRCVTYSIAWIASILQFLGVVVGTLLILMETPHPMILKHVMPLFHFK